MTSGLLLLNLGTPNKPEIGSVMAYFSQFLTDKRVINLPALMRYLLVYLFIIPLRSMRSTNAYKSIWTDQGSPLLVNSNHFVEQLQDLLGKQYTVALGMNYGKPSIQQALDTLKDCDDITILPLYPQYSSAATGSAIEKALQLIGKKEVIPCLNVIRDFYQHPLYIKAQATPIRNALQKDSYLLLSYHGIPELQIEKSCSNKNCTNLCPPPNSKNSGCYKAQCLQTSRLLAEELNLDPNHYSSSFQSRLGKTPWIKPYTDQMLIELASKGIKNLVIACPSFVADCLETIEEIGIRAKNHWFKLGGKQFTLIPSLNAHPEWVNAIQSIIETPRV